MQRLRDPVAERQALRDLTGARADVGLVLGESDGDGTGAPGLADLLVCEPPALVGDHDPLGSILAAGRRDLDGRVRQAAPEERGGPREPSPRSLARVRAEPARSVLDGGGHRGPAGPAVGRFRAIASRWASPPARCRRSGSAAPRASRRSPTRRPQRARQVYSREPDVSGFVFGALRDPLHDRSDEMRRALDALGR